VSKTSGSSDATKSPQKVAGVAPEPPKGFATEHREGVNVMSSTHVLERIIWWSGGHLVVRWSFGGQVVIWWSGGHLVSLKNIKTSRGPVDYTCEDGRFLAFARCVTISSVVKQRLILE
jgi:hypothetical protein